MNSATCSQGSRANTYRVEYDTGNGRFTISTTSSRNFQLDFGASNSIRNALGENTAGLQPNNAAKTYTTDSSRTLLFRDAGLAVTDKVGGTDETFL